MNERKKELKKMDVLMLSPEAKKLLIDIKFIGYCPENKKVSLQQRKYIEPNGWTLDNVWRQISWETRENLISYIDGVITKTTDFLKEEKNKDVIQLFLSSLEEMLVGIHHLRETYKNEPDVLSSLSVYIEQLKILIRNISSSSSSSSSSSYYQERK